MTKMTFENLSVLNADLADAVIEALNGIDGISARLGISNVSESAYCEARTDGDDPDVFKLRFSGHADYHGSDFTFRTDKHAVVMFRWDVAEAIEWDEDGEEIDWEFTSHFGEECDKPSDAEFSHVEFPAWRFDEIVAEAIVAAKGALKI